MVYVAMLEELRAEVSTATLAAVMARSQGADVEVPFWSTVRDDFDAWLATEPEPVNADREVLMRAYGMRG